MAVSRCTGYRLELALVQTDHLSDSPTDNHVAYREARTRKDREIESAHATWLIRGRRHKYQVDSHPEQTWLSGIFSDIKNECRAIWTSIIESLDDADALGWCAFLFRLAVRLADQRCQAIARAPIDPLPPSPPSFAISVFRRDRSHGKRAASAVPRHAFNQAGREFGALRKHGTAPRSIQLTVNLPRRPWNSRMYAIST